LGGVPTKKGRKRRGERERVRDLKVITGEVGHEDEKRRLGCIGAPGDGTSGKLRRTWAGDRTILEFAVRLRRKEGKILKARTKE